MSNVEEVISKIKQKWAVADTPSKIYPLFHTEEGIRKQIDSIPGSTGIIYYMVNDSEVISAAVSK